MASIRQIITGLEILARYLPEGQEEQIGGADHDIIYGPAVRGEVSPEDAAQLRAAGWHLSDETGWCRFA